RRAVAAGAALAPERRPAPPARGRREGRRRERGARLGTRRTGEGLLRACRGARDPLARTARADLRRLFLARPGRALPQLRLRDLGCEHRRRDPDAAGPEAPEGLYGAAEPPGGGAVVPYVAGMRAALRPRPLMPDAELDALAVAAKTDPNARERL